MEDLNIDLRSKILEYSLNLEYYVNKLILLNLSIFNEDATKNFGNKVGISFKNKIDLLFDLDILEQDELNNLEVLMVFRNKFLHDIKINSFTKIISQLDNGIVNRFKKFCINESFKSENDFIIAFDNLYINNIDLLIKKITKRFQESKFRNDTLKNIANGYEQLQNESLNVTKKIIDLIENQSDDINPELNLKISKILNDFQNSNCLSSTNKTKTILNSPFLKNILK